MGKIAWGIAGSGHFMRESLQAASHFPQGKVDFFISPAGLEVLKFYNMPVPPDAITDKSASTASCRAFAGGTYDLFVIAPATSNSVAKFVLGISDSMLTTLFAQCGKSRVPIVVLPSDTEENVDSMGATKPLKVYPRPVDLENVEKLKKFHGVSVAVSIEELDRMLARYKA
jgi:dihydromethanopterin reductase (acceptor)